VEKPNHRVLQPATELPDDDRLVDIFSQGGDYLPSTVYRLRGIRLEPTEYGHPRHNLNYWTLARLFGPGRGGPRKISQRNEPNFALLENPPTAAYLNRIGSRTAGSEAIAVGKERPLSS